MEEKVGKKKSNIIWLIITIVVGLALACGGFYLGQKVADMEQTKEEQKQPEKKQEDEATNDNNGESGEDTPNDEPSEPNQGVEFNIESEQKWINSASQMGFLDLKKLKEIEWLNKISTGKIIDNKKVVSEANLYYDDAVYDVYALTEDGSFYVSFFDDESYDKVNISYKVKRIGTFNTHSFEHCVIEQHLVLEASNGNKYVSWYDSNLKEYTFDKKIEDVFNDNMIVVDMPFECYIVEEVTNIGRVYINNSGNISFDGKSFISVAGKYFASVSDDKTLKYYIASDNKLYIVDKKTDSIEAVANVKSVNIETNNSKNDRAIFSKGEHYTESENDYYILTITLDNNKTLVFSTK